MVAHSEALREASQFLSALYGTAASGLLTIFTLPDRQTRYFPISEIEQAASYAVATRTRCNVYFGLGLRKTVLASSQRGQVGDVIGIPGVWLDVDVQGPAHKSDRLPPTFEAAEALINEFPLKPSLVVQSGHGLQAHWLFKELWMFDDDSERQAAATLVQRFQATLQGCAAIKGYTIDSTHDLARVLRLPGTLNHKLEPTPVFIQANNGVSYNPEDFDKYLAESPPQQQPSGLATSDEHRTLGKPSLEFVANGAPMGEQRSRAVAAARGYLAAGYTVRETAAALWRGLQASPADPDKPPWTQHDAVEIASDLAVKPPSKPAPMLAQANAMNGHNPVVPNSAPWPSPLEADAFHGLAGDVVAEIRPHTEADDAALLINFLAAFGNAVGRSPHAIAEADRHGCNLFAVLVGETAKGRKGSSWGHVKELFTRSDPTWAGSHVVQGLSSGEGLLWTVRDPIERMVPVKEKGRPTGEYDTVVEDLGVADKRLLVLESEFASVLKVMAREGNTLSPVLRGSWDTGDLRTLTKNSPAQATRAHISVVGHITKGELLRYLNDTEAGNGFGNRFLWTCTQRARVLPEGGGTVNYGPLVERLHAALERGRKIARLERDSLARHLWAEVYPALSEGKPGLFGSITARAEAQVLRLSLLFAVLDGAAAIDSASLKAALAVWEYCEASARYVFGDATGDPIADQILRALRTAGELTRTAISALFNRNEAAARIEHALKTLQTAGLAWSETRPPADGSGRPAEVWHG